MPKASCPVCDAEIDLTKGEAHIGNRVTCPDCGALLEVIEENPLELEEVYEEKGEDLF